MNSNGTPKWQELVAIVKDLSAIPLHAIEYLKGKSSNLLLSAQMSEGASSISLHASHITRIQEELNKLHKSSISPSQWELDPLSQFEVTLIRNIQTETNDYNLNNITRTKAYYDIYERHPVLHWAFLAHMVSRNGGWNMSDLQGEFIPKLLKASLREELFQLLERVNALIFQDAYPQLKLYEESVKHGINLFHLLPHFHVSSFMKPVWDIFWQEGSSPLLTVALIINEQHYIEGRVIGSEPYRSLLDNILFPLQAVLQMNAIVFPYRTSSSEALSSHRLAGLVIEFFSDLEERIEVGKKLYALLFSVPDISEGAAAFSANSPHTGSRADYWPYKFTHASLYPHANSEHCIEKRPLYSPKLADAWQNEPFESPDRYDWLTDLDALKYLRSDPTLPLAFEITNEYEFILLKLETALEAEQLLDH